MSVSRDPRWRRRGSAAALVALVLPACGAPSGERPAPPELPPLAELEPEVAAEIGFRSELLEEMLADPEAEDSDLAIGFGILGEIFHAYSLLEKARTCYLGACTLAPDDARWTYLLGHVERRRGELAASSAAFERVLELWPADVPTRVWLGENALDRHRLEAAGERFTEALERRPDCVKARIGIARVALAKDSPAEALAALETAFAAQPQATEILYLLGQLHRRLGDRVRADELLAQVPADPDAHRPIDFNDPVMQQVADLRISAEVRMRRASRALARDRYEIAVDELSAALAATPERPDARYNLAAALYRLGRSDEALEQVQTLLESHPEHTLGRVLLARLRMGSGEYEEASRELDPAMTAAPSAAAVHLARGDLARRQHDERSALTSYRRARELAPEREAAWVGEGIALLRLGRYAEAASRLEQGTVALPESRPLALLRIRLLAAAPNAALRQGEQAVDMAERLGDPLTVAVAETVAMAMAEVGRYDDAIRWQSAALEPVDPASPAGRRIVERLGLYRRRQPCREPWGDGEAMGGRRVRRPEPESSPAVAAPPSERWDARGAVSPGVPAPLRPGGSRRDGIRPRRGASSPPPRRSPARDG